MPGARRAWGDRAVAVLWPDAVRGTQRQRRERRRSAIVLGQLPFLGVLVVVLGIFVLAEPQVFEHPLFRAGIALAVASVAIALLVPWQRLDHVAGVAVPVLQLVAVVLVQQSGVELVVLAVFPVLWLAGSFGRPGLVLAVLGSLLSGVDADLMTAQEVRLSEASSTLLRPVTLTAVALTVSLLAHRIAVQRTRILEQQAATAAALAESGVQRRLLDQVLDTIDAAVVVVAPDATIVLRNRAHRSLVPEVAGPGQPAATIAGLGGFAADGVTPLSPERAPLLRAARGERIEGELTWWGPPDGRRRAMRVFAAPLRADDGTLLQGVLAYHDVTDEMAALAQRDEFVSAVSHELRTPLSAILGHLELAVDDPATSTTTRRHVDIAVRNAERLLAMIDDLLTAGDVLRRGLALRPQETDLHELVRVCLESQQAVAEKAGVTLESTLRGVEPVLADPPRLRQVLDNLVSNAVKYSRRGGTVRVGAGDGPAGTVVLTVADDGPGISESDLPHVFDRFYRTPTARAGRVAGTGLGLHIVRQLVEAHGGTVRLDSEPGHGTVATVELPRTSGRAA